MTDTIVYIPALHAGILQFLSESDGTVWVLGSDVISLIDEEFDYLRKEIRALKPEDSLTAVTAVLPSRNCKLLTTTELKKLNTKTTSLLLPQEDIFSWLYETHLPHAKISFSTTFLRWNRSNTLETHKPNTPIAETFAVANQSSDWWRQVGCALVKDGTIINTAFNHHLPSPYTPYIDSDPRNSFHKGEHIDLSTAIHAEAALIADAARKGISLENAELYVTTFPCPVCAKLIAASGIKKLYFSEGYSMLDGETVLSQAGVKTHKISEPK
ncbi:MAG: deoxycytidylate deaminase [Pseudomonadales bacterium]|nr:deoxycytidylate deaminase [Candidatus Woesebacteria bacterium]MCB9801344.1 deoxycytidylate deaminase [Pseudomonadales bacterium]